ncbi:MAG: TetR/AcrR family transcriptional regulator [Calothrix sp. MO_167.B12]|nr:TetR/AcrR family transcriptional regulator [Calothrix sp. MO_167.B12]
MATLVNSEIKETKKRLLETALNLIWENNYESVGIAQICEEAGVTKGAFYHYFQSKADLVTAAFTEYWQQTRLEMDRIFSSQNTPIERVNLYCEMLISKQKMRELQTGNVLGCPFISSGHNTQEKQLKQLTANTVQNVIKYFVSLINDAQHENLISQELNAEDLARYMYEFIHGVLILARLKNDLDIIRNDLQPGILRILGLQTVTL